VFLIQDYHLTLVPRMLRELAPDARILHFSHTPFAGRTYFRTLPDDMRRSVLRGMLGADVVGFQGRQWGENFLLSVRELDDVHVDIRAHRAEVDGREVQVRSFPVAVGAQEIREAARSDRAKRLRAQVEKIRGDRKLLLRVDRLEPSKNILRGFLAFELLLQKHPEWRGRVVFLALLSPSREEVPAYRDYGADCRAAADRINAAFGKEDWTPIVLKVQENFTYAVAAYDQYDAMLVNPVHDGMNLVAMEGPVLNSRGGALILSRNAGAYGRLGRHALAINPFDLSETAEAIREALEMPEEERTRRARGLQRSALSHTPATWLAAQLRAIDDVRSPAL
jgi:trehalose 6-phosphate synthase